MRALLLAFICLISAPALAQDNAQLAQKLELSKQMVEIRPVKHQVESAINRYIEAYTPNASETNRSAIRAKLLELINVKSLEQTAIDAYAETFTLEELEAMVAYFSSPLGRAAAGKQKDLNAKIAPDIIEMIDRALMSYRLENTPASKE
jgi:hypothetical protein